MKYAYKGEKWHLVLQPMHVAKCIVLYGNTVTDSWIMSVGYVALYALCHNNPVMSLKKSKQ